jgi:hypothetical protein
MKSERRLDGLTILHFEVVLPAASFIRSHKTQDVLLIQKVTLVLFYTNTFLFPTLFPTMSDLFTDFELPVATIVSPLETLVGAQGLTTPREGIGAGEVVSSVTDDAERHNYEGTRRNVIRVLNVIIILELVETGNLLGMRRPQGAVGSKPLGTVGRAQSVLPPGRALGLCSVIHPRAMTHAHGLSSNWTEHHPHIVHEQ